GVVRGVTPIATHAKSRGSRPGHDPGQCRSSPRLHGRHTEKSCITSSWVHKISATRPGGFALPVRATRRRNTWTKGTRMTWFEGTAGARRSGARQRGIIVALLTVAFMAAGAANAAATMRIEQHTDPAGDPTLFHYIETDPRPPHVPIEFDLRDGEHKDFGPFAGVGTAQAVVPAGWRVVDIQCVSAHPGAPA